jgi:hypothetical protein
MKYLLKWIAWILVVIGGINWGLVGFLNFNLVARLFGSIPRLVTIVYDLVGLSAIILIAFKVAKMSKKK